MTQRCQIQAMESRSSNKCAFLDLSGRLSGEIVFPDTMTRWSQAIQLNSEEPQAGK